MKHEKLGNETVAFTVKDIIVKYIFNCVFVNRASKSKWTTPVIYSSDAIPRVACS